MSWEMVKLGDVATFVNGYAFKPSDWSGNGLEIIRIQNLTKGSSETNYFKGLIPEKYKVVKDDILISWSATIDIFVWSGCDAWLNQHIFKVVFDKIEINRNYFIYAIKNILEDMRKQVHGATMQHITKGKFDSILIPLPPLATQKRIAEILDAADALKRKDQQLLKKYDELAQAIFIDMFGDPVKNEKGWEVKTIEQMVKKSKHSIKRGPFGGALKKEIFVDDGYLVYEQFHALNNDFNFGRYYITEEKYNELIAFDVKPNDIIISCSGVYLGKLAIIPENSKPGIINQALLKLTLDENVYKNDFFVKVFTQENFKNTYFDSDRGAAIPNFPPMATFKQFKFICPPIEKQNEYLLIVKNLQNQIGLFSNGNTKTDNLFQTLIQKAFNGELVN
jgi:type I restriction enzyme S subunit